MALAYLHQKNGASLYLSLPLLLLPPFVYRVTYPQPPLFHPTLVCPHHSPAPLPPPLPLTFLFHFKVMNPIDSIDNESGVEEGGVGGM